VALLLAVYALAVSIFVPLYFFTMGPVRERRILLGLTYSALCVFAWAASLLLSFQSEGVFVLVSSIVLTIVAFSAFISHRDEKLLARFDRDLADPESRARAIEDLGQRIREIGTEGERVVAVMELASFPIQRLMDRCYFEDARSTLALIQSELGPRLDSRDSAELHTLAMRCFMHHGSLALAERELASARAARVPASEDLDVLEALLCASRGDFDRAAELARRGTARPFSGRVRDLALLARAHVAAGRGREDEAIAHLRAVRRDAWPSIRRLARALSGPATELCDLIERRASPYR
jgi:hypothetical protein